MRQIALHYAAKCVPLCRKMRSIMPQNALHYAAKCHCIMPQNAIALCRKTQHSFVQIALLSLQNGEKTGKNANNWHVFANFFLCFEKFAVILHVQFACMRAKG